MGTDVKGAAFNVDISENEYRSILVHLAYFSKGYKPSNGNLSLLYDEVSLYCGAPAGNVNFLQAELVKCAH